MVCQWSRDYPHRQATEIAKHAHEQFTGHRDVTVHCITESDTSGIATLAAICQKSPRRTRAGRGGGSIQNRRWWVTFSPALTRYLMGRVRAA